MKPVRTWRRLSTAALTLATLAAMLYTIGAPTPTAADMRIRILLTLATLATLVFTIGAPYTHGG